MISLYQVNSRCMEEQHITHPVDHCGRCTFNQVGINKWHICSKWRCLFSDHSTTASRTHRDTNDTSRDIHGPNHPSDMFSCPEDQLQHPYRCVFSVTPPCVWNSHFRFWATAGRSWWTGWSWPPYTSPSTLRPPCLQPRSVLDLKEEYCSGPGWRGPDPCWAPGHWAGRQRPWRKGSGLAGIFLSLLVRRPRPGASSPVSAAQRWFWEHQGSPRRPRGWGTWPDSGKWREAWRRNSRCLKQMIKGVNLIVLKLQQLERHCTISSHVPLWRCAQLENVCFGNFRGFLRTCLKDIWLA